MPFFPTKQARYVGPDGSTSAKICLIGEAPGATEEKLGKPFVGSAGSVLEQCLHGAGIIRSDCYITNLVKTKPVGNNIAPWYRESTTGRPGTLTDLGVQAMQELWEELREVKANILVPMGKPAMLAILGTDKISRYRGYVMESRTEYTKGAPRKVIPTYHPAAALRQYILRYYISNDLKKVKIESRFPQIVRPEREITWPDSFDSAMEWLDYLEGCPRLSIDIEVINFEVSCIGFSDDPSRAFSLPMYHSPAPMWSVEHEAVLWRRIASIMGADRIVKVFQNGIFDVHFLRVRCGVVVDPLTPEMYEDTMIAHHIMFPEMLKGLEFLVSLYGGAQRYYKDMVRFANIKDNA